MKKLKSIKSRSPQKKRVCLRVFTLSPKKPNSANRKVARVKLSNKKVIVAFIPRERHNLQEHSVVLVRGRRPKDLPRVNHRIIRRVFDTSRVTGRKSSRSKFGVKKSK